MALRRQMAAEEEQLERRRKLLLAKGRREYAARIQSVVERRWTRPAGSPAGLRCKVFVEQTKSGDVVSVRIQESSGDVAFDRSVEHAVLGASPLPRPKDPALFERQILFVFERRFTQICHFHFQLSDGDKRSSTQNMGAINSSQNI